MVFVQQGFWTLFAFFTLVAAQTVGPTNTTTDASSTNSIILTPVQPSNIASQISIVPLTAEADSALPPRGIQGSIELTTPNNAANASGKIAYISCDPADYNGFKQASDVVSQVISSDTSAVLLYSTTSKFCSYTAGSSDFSFIYSMTDSNASSNLAERLRDNPQSNMLARITHEDAVSSSDNGTSNDSGNQNNNPLGPSPTTTVAMIILYSITGVITALFLIVIITGAIRAHRHPERYGPRSGTGRVRQSRARGIARAMLETLPIVKFGEREQSKPADAELGEHGTTETAREASQENAGAQTSTEESTQTAPTLMTHQVSGLAPAENEATASGSASTNMSKDDGEGLTCSLCLNDFEVGEELRVLPCNHRFHPGCVDRWLLEVSGTCPLCRMDLHPQTSHTSETSNGENDDSPDGLAPPLDEPEPSTETQPRPRGGLRDRLHFRHLRDASQEERISTLRRMRERPDGAESSPEENNRRRGLRTRLLDSFGVRTSTLASSETAQAASSAQTREEQSQSAREESRQS